MTVATGTEPIVKEVQIDARPETVFGFFTEADKLTRWLCEEATTDPRPGGVCLQTHRAGESRGDQLFHMRGEFVEITPPSRLVFTWGFDEPSVGVAPGSSTIEVTLEPEGGGTRLTLVHRDLPEAELPSHDEGWDYQLARLVIAAAGGDPDA